mgnify:CR=1 FL=1
MTHKPGHKTDPNYDKLPYEAKKRFDLMIESTRKKKKKKKK